MSPEDRAEDLALKLVGNHRRFEAFAWSARPEDDSNWALVYTTNRDADALTRSNHRIITRELAVYATGEDDADVREERHGHWAVGWVEGFAIRVRREDGNLTGAFLAYAELACSIESYPALDEDDWSNEEDEEAQQVWLNCYNDRERLDYIRRHWREFESCTAKWRPALEAWRTLLSNVRGEQFDGYASELINH